MEISPNLYQAFGYAPHAAKDPLGQSVCDWTGNAECREVLLELGIDLEAIRDSNISLPTPNQVEVTFSATWGQAGEAAGQVLVEETGQALAEEVLVPFGVLNAVANASGQNIRIQTGPECGGEIICGELEPVDSKIARGAAAASALPFVPSFLARQLDKASWVKFVPPAPAIPRGLMRKKEHLTRALGGGKKGFQAHHLIPVSVAKDIPVMRKAAELGYDIDRASNGIMLPTTKELAAAEGLPRHRGGHLPEYFEETRKRLFDLQEAYEFGEVADDAILKNLEEIESQIQADLIQGKLRLHND